MSSKEAILGRVLVGTKYHSAQIARDAIQQVLMQHCPCILIKKSSTMFVCNEHRKNCTLRITFANTDELQIVIKSVMGQICHLDRAALFSSISNIPNLVEKAYFFFHLLLTVKFDPSKMYTLFSTTFDSPVFLLPTPRPIYSFDKKKPDILEYYKNINGTNKISSLKKSHQLFCAMKIIRFRIEELAPHDLRELIRKSSAIFKGPEESVDYVIQLSRLEEISFTDLSSIMEAIRNCHERCPGLSLVVKTLTYRVYKIRESGKFNSQIECSEASRGCRFKLTIQKQESNGATYYRLLQGYHNVHTHNKSIADCAENRISDTEMTKMIDSLTINQRKRVCKLISLKN